MARLYSNENFPRRVVEVLRLLGHDVLTSLEAERANQRIPDDQVLEFAMAEKRALLALNRLDFFRLHKTTQVRHFGIIACTRDDANPEALAQRIHDAIAKAEQLEGQCLRIVRPYA